MVAAGIVVLLVLIAIVVLTLICLVTIGVACGERAVADLCRYVTCGCCGRRPRPPSLSEVAPLRGTPPQTTVVLAPYAGNYGGAYPVPRGYDSLPPMPVPEPSPDAGSGAQAADLEPAAAADLPYDDRTLEERREDRYYDGFDDGYDQAYTAAEEKHLQREYDKGFSEGKAQGADDFAFENGEEDAGSDADLRCAPPDSPRRRWPTYV